MLDEETALRLVNEAVERSGGSQYIHGNPRHPFALNADNQFEIEGHTVTIRFSEISSPAIAEVEGYIYEIRDDELIKLFGPQ